MNDLNKTFIIQPIITLSEDSFLSGVTFDNNSIYYNMSDAPSAFTTNLNSIVINSDNLNLEGYSESGTKNNGDLIVNIGDYNGSNNNTSLILNDNLSNFIFSGNSINYFTNETPLFNSSLYHKKTIEPKVSGTLAYQTQVIDKTSSLSGYSNVFYADIRSITDSSNDDGGGSVGLALFNRNTGNHDLGYLYATDVTSRHSGTGDVGFLIGQSVKAWVDGTNPSSVSTIIRGLSSNSKMDNPNTDVGVIQGYHATVELRSGSLISSQILYLDYDVTPNDPDLIITGDVSYIEGGSDNMNNLVVGGKKRFIKYTGNLESDLNGIINTNVDVSAIEAGTPKILTTKEWVTGYTNTIAAGNDTEIQFNDNGSFGASSGLTYSGSTLFVDGNVNANSFIKSGSTSNDVLLGDGSTTSLDTITDTFSTVINVSYPMLGLNEEPTDEDIIMALDVYRQGYNKRIGETLDYKVFEKDFRFTLVFKSDNSGLSADNQVIIPTTGGGYNYNITTDDGYIATGLTGNHTITFPSGAGTHTVYITGDFPRIYYNGSFTNDMLKLTEISNWGRYGIGSTSQQGAFRGCENMIGTFTDTPDFSTVENMASMFFNADLFNQDISSWDVSNVTDMRSMFRNTAFNQDINSWNVSNVILMDNMFDGATTFNQDLNSWNVSGVTNMDSMFTNATAFNGDISSWNVSGVTNMFGMFFNATSFNQDISSWDVSNVENMGGMLNTATSFNQDLNSWNVSGVTNMDSMFASTTSFNQDLNSWDVSNVIFTLSMFRGATAFNGDISSWNVSNVENMANMFFGATAFNQDISSWDVSNVTEMNNMFRDATSFNQDLSGWCVAQIPSEPFNFDTNTISWVLPKPNWGAPCL